MLSFLHILTEWFEVDCFNVTQGASVGTLVDFAHSCGGRIKEEIEEIPTSNEHPGTINDRMPVSFLPNSVNIKVDPLENWYSNHSGNDLTECFSI